MAVREVPNVEKTTRKSVLPYYGVAAVWVVYALAFDLYRPIHFLTAAALSAGVFALLRAVCPDAAVEIPKAPEPEARPETTGNEELDKMIRDGDLAMAEMRRLDEAIEDETVSAQIRRLEEISAKIFDQVRADPKKLPEIRRFMDYYLPTTLKILNAYDRMGAAGVSGENIGRTMDRVEELLAAIVAAFEKQLDSLFGAEAMDLRAEMAVLETMLAREGLAGEQMEAETTKKADGSDIDLKL